MRYRGLTPLESWRELWDMRKMFKRMMEERITHPGISLEGREYYDTYYSKKIEALDVAMTAIMTKHKLKVEPEMMETT